MGENWIHKCCVRVPVLLYEFEHVIYHPATSILLFAEDDINNTGSDCWEFE